MSGSCLENKTILNGLVKLQQEVFSLQGKKSLSSIDDCDASGKEKQRYYEQVFLRENGNVAKALKVLLQDELRKLGTYTHKRVFISYSWPDKEYPHEDWTQRFAESLAEDLKLAGLIFFLDKINSDVGTEVRTYMREKINNTDVMIFLCNRTLKFKHDVIGHSNVCYEILEATARCTQEARTNVPQNKRLRIVPLRLVKDGIDITTATFPILAEESLFRDGYVIVLKRLIKRIYEFGEENIDYADIWKNFKKIVDQEKNYASS